MRAVDDPDVSIERTRQPKIHLDVEDAFTAGLLHDIGKTALANSHRAEYEQVMARVYNEKISFVKAEKDHVPGNL